MAEAGYGFPMGVPVMNGVSVTVAPEEDLPKEVRVEPMTLTVDLDHSPPNVIVDESSLGEHRIKNAENLQKRLQMRREYPTLVDQGIMPPIRTPPAFYEQRQRFERAKISDKLKAKIQQRPNRDVLIQQHILEETGNVDPSLVEKHKQLKRARIADQLNKSISDRPGPLEVIQAGILHVNDSLENDVKDGKIQFKKTSEGSAARRPLRPFSFVDDETGPPPNAIAVAVDKIIVQPSTPNESLAFKSESILPTMSPPAREPTPSTTTVSVPVSRCASMPVFSPSPGQQSYVPNRSKMLQRSAGGGKARSVKPSKANGSQAQKQKVYTFHMYHGPSSAQKKEQLSARPETKYEILVQQQQTILQYELETQQKRILPNQGQKSSSETVARKNSRSSDPAPKSLSKMEDMKVKDLKIEAQIRGLPVSGSKAQLIERLQPYADVITSAAHGSVPTNSNQSQSPVSQSVAPVANQGSFTVGQAIYPVIAPLAEPLVFQAPGEAVGAKMADNEMDVDEPVPLTLTQVFSAPVILNVNEPQPASAAQLPIQPGLPIFVPVVNVPIVPSANALPVPQQPLVALAPRQLQMPPPPYHVASAQASEGVIHQIMNQFKELKEQLDSTEEKKKTPLDAKMKFQWPGPRHCKKDEKMGSWQKLRWNMNEEARIPCCSGPEARTLPDARSCERDHEGGRARLVSGSVTFTLEPEDDNPSVMDIQPTFFSNATKSQVVDDILAIAIKNGDLPPRAANDVLTPTLDPDAERMESGPSFPLGDRNNNENLDPSPMNDENANVETLHPPPTPPPMPSQQLGVCPSSASKSTKDFLMETNVDSCDFNDFLSMIGSSATTCDFFPDMDLSLLDNCGGTPCTSQPKKDPKANGFLPNVNAQNVSVNVNVSNLLDSWATSATTLAEPAYLASNDFDAQALLDY